jgi:hypothetical protein
MSWLRQEIHQLIDDAGEVLEQTTRRPLVRRDFRNMVYKERENALVDEPSPPELQHDEGAEAENEFKEAVAEAIEALAKETATLRAKITTLELADEARRFETKRCADG